MNGIELNLTYNSIIKIESNGEISKISTDDPTEKQFILECKIGDIIGEFCANGFIRIHRHTLLNPGFIDFEKTDLTNRQNTVIQFKQPVLSNDEYERLPANFKGNTKYEDWVKKETAKYTPVKISEHRYADVKKYLDGYCKD